MGVPKVVLTQPKKFREKARERFLSRGGLGRFIRALDEIEDTGSVSAIRLLFYTGCRKTEILSLPQKHVNFDEGTIFLGDTRTGRPRTVHLSEIAKKVLDEQMGRAGKSEFIFPGKEGPINWTSENLSTGLLERRESRASDCMTFAIHLLVSLQSDLESTVFQKFGATLTLQ